MTSRRQSPLFPVIANLTGPLIYAVGMAIACGIALRFGQLSPSVFRGVSILLATYAVLFLSLRMPNLVDNATGFAIGTGMLTSLLLIPMIPLMLLGAGFVFQADDLQLTLAVAISIGTSAFTLWGVGWLSRRKRMPGSLRLATIAGFMWPLVIVAALWDTM